MIQMETINKLLKKQAPKRRGRAAVAATPGDKTPNEQEIEAEKANPLYVRWVSNKGGSRVAVPTEWFGKKVGRIFGDAPPVKVSPGRLVEEVD